MEFHVRILEHFIYIWNSWVDYTEIVSDHEACIIFSYASHLLYLKKKIFCYSSSFLLYIYLCYLITLLVRKASGTIANVQTCLKEHYYQHNLKCLKYLLNVELLQPSNGVIICVMGFSNTSENRAGYKWEFCATYIHHCPMWQYLCSLYFYTLKFIITNAQYGKTKKKMIY